MQMARMDLEEEDACIEEQDARLKEQDAFVLQGFPLSALGQQGPRHSTQCCAVTRSLPILLLYRKAAISFH
jgi:hypothetical protein